MTDMTVHVFAGKFSDRKDACAYALDQWEPEPLLMATDEEHRAWEERNATWQMRTDLGGVYLDHDFIEVIDDVESHTNRYDYLRSMLNQPDDIDLIRQRAGSQANILVLVFSEALGGFEAEMRSTPRVTYCGEFPCVI